MDQNGTTIDALANLAASLSDAEFVEQHPGFYLVALGDMREIHDEQSAQMTKLETPTSGVRSVDGERLAPNGALVWALHKYVEMFPAKIMVGRTGNNDVVIPHPTISKFHAYFALTPEAPKLIEAGSRNQSRINGERVTSELKPRSLKSGDTVQFGAACPLMVCDGHRLLQHAQWRSERG